MLLFIIFEIVAQAYLVATFYSFRDKLINYINYRILTIKIILVSILIIVAVISIPIISLPGNDFFGFNLKFFKHALEWDYFIGVISFYLLTFFMWKKINFLSILHQVLYNLFYHFYKKYMLDLAKYRPQNSPNLLLHYLIS